MAIRDASVVQRPPARARRVPTLSREEARNVPRPWAVYPLPASDPAVATPSLLPSPPLTGEATTSGDPE